MAVTFGEKMKIEIYGQSHAEAIGVRIEGLPAGMSIDQERLQAFLDRRAPGRNEWSTSRKEPDKPVFLSGVRERDAKMETDGDILVAEIRNTNIRPNDYTNTSVVPRPAHADYPAWVKYGEIASGGGAFSARMTAPLCIAGGICMQWLAEMGITVQAHIKSIGNIEDAAFDPCSQIDACKCDIAKKEFPVIDESRGEAMKTLIAHVKEEGDSIGGSIECMILGLEAGIGEPIFGSIESRVCQAIFAVPAVKGIEFGKGFAVSKMTGSENNDPYHIEAGIVKTKTNNHGGILGGLSSGMPILFHVAMKPTPSIAKEQESVDLNGMTETTLQVKGRHDPCIVPRAVPCIEAAAAIAICDLLMEEGVIHNDDMDLSACRHQIDRIDRQLAGLLEERLDVVRDVIRYKERNGLPVLDSSREKTLLDGLAESCREETLPYIQKDFEAIMAVSRQFQEEHRLQYGLLGKKLGHSHSPYIHQMLGGYEYGLYERTEEQLDEFMRNGRFKGISVTMPYKRAVMPYCSSLSDRAKACNSVNTIVRLPDGSLYGDNTDYVGFRYTVEQSGVDVSSAKALVLGSGGVSGTVINVLKDLGADPVINVSRAGEDNYENLERHSDAEIIVNATPVGMFPKAGVSLIDLEMFPRCKGVFDLVYNPLKTKIMLDAEKRGIPAFGGLAMLVAQAAEGCRLFTGQAVSDEKVEACIKQMQSELEHIILIGMPGCGKTTVGKLLAQKTGRAFVDLDEQIARETGRTPEEIIRTDGIDAFRDIETDTLQNVVRDASRTNTQAGLIIATGGGIVEREENASLLRENGCVIYLRRPLEELPANNRPVTQSDGLAAIYERRHEKYETWSDVTIDNKTPGETADIIEQIVYI